MYTIPKAEKSHDPMAWQRAANALKDIGQTVVAKICHEVAGHMMRDANAVDDYVVKVAEVKE